MSELEDMIGKILGDPEQMERLGSMASKLFGGEDEPADSAPDISALGSIGKLMSGMGSGGKEGLVSALGPYLKPDRRRRLEKAAGISRLARIAGLALEEYENGGLQ